MLSLQEIKPFYPTLLQSFDRFILREYLQYKILEIIFESDFKSQLSFLGGTCLRIVHNNQRFSEDLDFDNFNLASADFDKITEIVKLELERIGYQVEMRNVKKGAFHCYVRFPELLFNEGLTGHKTEKILIQLDTEAHNYHYESTKPILNKFDVFTQINCTPLDLLLAQKFYAILNRKRNKGRDFFDVTFLLGLNIKPDYNYLNVKTDTANPDSLKDKIVAKCQQLNMKEMAKDVKPFLFNAKDEKRVLLFEEYIKSVEL